MDLESSASSVKVKLDFDDGCMVYEVEFYASYAEYDYKIDAVTGQIFSRDVDKRSAAQNDGVVSGGNAPADIGEAKAKVISLNHAGGKEPEVTFIKAKPRRVQYWSMTATSRTTPSHLRHLRSQNHPVSIKSAQGQQHLHSLPDQATSKKG